MYKNYPPNAYDVGKNRRARYKSILVMKLIVMLTLIACLKVTASARAQTVSLTIKDAPIEKVFGEIKKQTGYGFWYEKNDLKNVAKVSIAIRNGSIKEALDQCFNGLPLTYQIVDKTIVVRKKEKSLLEKVTNFFDRHVIGGKVTDENGKPLPGVNVTVKGTSKTVTTKDDGTYSIDANEGDAIVYSFLGYETIERTVGKESAIEVSLKVQVGMLNAVSVVSTGFQTLSKERATGSFSKVGHELFERRVSSNLIDRLDGVTNGLVFNKNQSPNDINGSPIAIRGLSTIYANARPLIVVDNFPFDGDLSSLNPNDIDDITVLKDAAAASIWGARSGNGVIVITTKKGRRDQPLSINLNANFTYGERPDITYNKSYLNSGDFIDAERFLFGKGYYDANLTNTTTRPVVSPVVEILAKQRSGALTAGEAESQINGLKAIDLRDDMSKYIYQSTATQQYALNLSGGAKDISYYVAAGYDKVPSIVKGNSYDRLSLTSNTSYSPVKNLEATIGINYTLSNSINNGLSTLNPGSSKNNYYPYARLADDNGNALALPKDYRYSYISGLGTSQLLDWTYRPLEESGLADNVSRANYVRVNTGLKYGILPGLSIEAKYQLEKQNLVARNNQSQAAYFVRNLINLNTQVSGTNITRPIPLGGILDQSREELTGNSFRAQANFGRVFGKDHEINAIAGVDMKELVVNQNSWRMYGYSDQVGTSTPVDYNTTYSKYAGLATVGKIPYTDRGDRLSDEYMSYFANAAYAYKGRYTVSGSARIDQSNLFGVNTNQKSVPLWSAGVAWQASREGFYKVGFLPLLKLRATYGYNGNIDKSLSAYTTAIFSNDGFTSIPAVTIQNPPNPELRWERIGMLNVGLDFAARNGVLSGSIEYFHKNGNDIIGFAPVDPTVGVTQFKGNVAEISGNGVDVELSSTLGIKVKWNGTLLFSYATDKVTSYNRQATVGAYLSASDGSIGTSAITPVVGKPVYSIFSYPWAGLDPANGDPQGYYNNVISKDYAAMANSKNLSDAIYNGPARPTVFGSFRNGVSYQGVSISMNVVYKFGYYFRKPALNYGNLATNWIGTEDYGQRWQKAGDELTTNVPSFTYPLNTARDTFYQLSSVNVEKGDHIRLQDIRVSYLFPKLKRRGVFKDLEVYAYMNNVGILWKATKTDIDPDYIRNAYVNPRTYALGIRSSF